MIDVHSVATTAIKNPMVLRRLLFASCAIVGVMALLSACGATPANPPVNAQQTIAVAPVPSPIASTASNDARWLNKLTWGVNATEIQRLRQMGRKNYLQSQLQTDLGPLPNEVQSQIDQMGISRQSMLHWVRVLDLQRKKAEDIRDPEAKSEAIKAYQQELNRLARESASRHILRALYSPKQVQEQMTWFWLNHFNVFQNKANIRAMIADYEEHAIRPNALGSFRKLLGAVSHHPAMLRYLDNDRNVAGRINENYARELMELHTLGVNGGYQQNDVQELARILTGVGVNVDPDATRVSKSALSQYVQRGLFEFHPQRHDDKPKLLLGKPIRSTGLGEYEEALDRLASHPSTARHISQKLARYWLGDEPSTALLTRLSQRFIETRGDIPSVLGLLFQSAEFEQANPFKDPTRFAFSAIRLMYPDKVILNTLPVGAWLQRMGQPLYGRSTPDGYPLAANAWNSSGQMATRFEIAKTLGSGNGNLFRVEGEPLRSRPAFPQLAQPLFFEAIAPTLSDATRQALDQADSPQEWNSFYLSSPDFMIR